MLITEYTNHENLRDFLNNYGFLDEATTGNDFSNNFINIVKIVAQILMCLLKLQKVKSFHGRLKLNNIHIDKTFKIQMNDYGLYNDIYRGFKSSHINKDKSEGDVTSIKK